MVQERRPGRSCAVPARVGDMAKKKGQRDYVVMQCSVCGHRNYRTPKQLRGTAKLELRKYCKWCRMHQVHKERKK
ncbi:MAG: hypothetical protein KatS3mg102_0957 [Planctomycetota bacterium]|nr:MAG: hypothetical protein KatS3mg102_0957 [Planctomycetota bacterium]